ncbi:MAG: signal peptidase II [gamma proteobacterium symbiont of Bathyaustriella thionipta]|nr:signal peptidase II [gamma proteobacterium symbiont of Bathyaustriella thionipta]
MLRWLWLSGLVILLDQFSKYWAVQSLRLHEQWPVFPSFSLTLAYNKGAAFSFLANAGGWQQGFFIIVAVLVTGFLLLWLWRLQAHQKWEGLALGLLIGGAIGNLIDRVLYGQVTDFILLYYGNWSWPAFNLADSAISAGVVILLLDAFFPITALR